MSTKQKTTPLRAAWVLIFNHGPKEAAHRGLYCLWSDGINSVVAFEGRDGALRYALELKAQGLGLPGPTRVAVKASKRVSSEGWRWNKTDGGIIDEIVGEVHPLSQKATLSAIEWRFI